MTGTEPARSHPLVPLVWEYWRQWARWPTTRQLDRITDREFGQELVPIVKSMPEALLAPDLTQWQYYWIPDDRTTVGLAVGGLTTLQDATPFVDLFLRALAYLVKRADEFEPTEPNEYLTVRGVELADYLTVEADDHRLLLAKWLLQADTPGLWQGISGSEESHDWAITLDERGARLYRGISTGSEFADRLVARRRADRAQHERMRASFDALVEPDLPLVDEPRTKSASAVEPVTGDTSKGDAGAVFVVHGRNTNARIALDAFLNSIGLRSIDFELDAVAGTGYPAPYTGEILREGFRQAQAVIVLFTPDEEVRLRADLAHSASEAMPSMQSRPNVYFEAGMSMISHPRRTVLVELGDVRVPTDLGGIHVVKLDDSPYKREALMSRLRLAGCNVQPDEPLWRSAGEFMNAVRDRR